MYIIFDGGNHGHNVNKGYGSFKIYDKKGGELIWHQTLEFIGKVTNNEAEYKTLIAALQWIRDHCLTCINTHIEGDSELVRNQVLGAYQVKAENLKPLYNKVIRLLQAHRFTYDHIPRSEVVRELGH